MTSPTKRETVLPYLLGGKDDPFFQDLSAVPVLADSPVRHSGTTAVGEAHSRDGTQNFEDIGGNWTLDRSEATADYYDHYYD